MKKSKTQIAKSQWINIEMWSGWVQHWRQNIENKIKVARRDQHWNNDEISMVSMNNSMKFHDLTMLWSTLKNIQK